MKSTRRKFFKSLGLALSAAIAAPALVHADSVESPHKVYPGDILCKKCGNKLYDAQKNLKYDFLTFDAEGYSYNSAFKCIYCGNLMSNMERWETFKTCPALVLDDEEVFADRADIWGLVPHEVQRRFETKLGLMEDGDPHDEEYMRLVHKTLNDVWAEWRRERAIKVYEVKGL